ncbi:glutaredoxin family protein [Priestia megaterium]|nr:glutaredoxin family protein [Priestia megaterium]
MEVIVYSTKSCGYCEQQKEFLLANGVNFQEVDIRENEDNFKEFKALGGLGTPLTVKKENGKITSKIMGFNKKKLSEEILV